MLGAVEKSKSLAEEEIESTMRKRAWERRKN